MRFEEPWLDERINRADRYENGSSPNVAGQFARHLRLDLDEAARRKRWALWRRDVPDARWAGL